MKPVLIHGVQGDLRIADMSAEGLSEAYQRVSSSGDAATAEKLKALYELSVLESDLELTAGDPDIPQLGGFHGQVRGKIPGFESHHIPAQSIQDEKADKLPTIAISKEDHAKTDSYRGRSHSRFQSFMPDVPREDTYKHDAADMIADGSYTDLVRDELYNIRDNCGHKYDGAIEQYLDAIADYISREGIPEAKGVPSEKPTADSHIVSAKKNNGNHSIDVSRKASSNKMADAVASEKASHNVTNPVAVRSSESGGKATNNSAIRISASDLESMIGNIESRLETLRQRLEAYRRQESNLYQMIGSGDSSAEAMLRAVQACVNATEKAVSIANAAVVMLRSTMSELDTYVADTSSILSSASSQIASGVSKAVSAAKLG